MFRKWLSIAVCICVSFPLVSLGGLPVQAVQSLSPTIINPLSLKEANQTITNQKCFFTENKGQWNADVLFMGRTDFGTIVFTQDAVYYQLVQNDATSTNILDDTFTDTFTEDSITTQTVQLSFVEAQNPTIQGVTRLHHYNNYLIGNDPEHWGIHCNNYTQITYTNVWNHIDLSYFFTPEGLKYEYYVHPGATIQDIQVQVIGAAVNDQNKSLELCTPLGSLKDDHLFVYGKDSLSPLSASFSSENNIFSFQVDKDLQKAEETIVIDPLVYSTYLGGSLSDYGYGISVDEFGNAYVVGRTYSSNFPMTKTVGGELAPGYQQTMGGYIDAFVTKLNADGTELLYSTYLGGSVTDTAYDITLDSAGNAYVVGYTYSNDFPISRTVGGEVVPGYQQTLNGTRDGFMIKLNSSGTELQYSSYLGGSRYDTCKSIALDNDGNAYIVGTTSGNDFPMNRTLGGELAPGYQQFSGGRDDGYAVKLNPSGTELLYATYLGGSEDETTYGVSIDSSNNAYVLSTTYSPNFPMDKTISGEVAPGYQKTFGGGFDGAIVKLNATGTEFVYATFLGGSESDFARSISLDSSNNAYVTGYTTSNDFPMTKTVGGEMAPGYQKTFGGDVDVFAVQLNSQGTELVYSTYIGGSSHDDAENIVMDANNNVYIVGFTDGNDFPMTKTVGGELAPGYQKTFGGDVDGFFVHLNSMGTELVYSTFLGGSYYDKARDVALDSSGNAYVVGFTYSNDFPMTKTIGGELAPGYQKTNTNSDAAFVVKVGFVPDLEVHAEMTPTQPSFQQGDEFTLNIDIRNMGGIATGSVLTLNLPVELSVKNCTEYPFTVTGNTVSVAIGDILPTEILEFSILLSVTTDVATQKTVSIPLSLTSNETSTIARSSVETILTPIPCPELYLEATPSKTMYQYGDLVYLNITVRNLGGTATGVELDLELPSDISYVSCDAYQVTSSGQNLTIKVGTMLPDTVLQWVMILEVSSKVLVSKSVPLVLEITANECDSFVREIVQIHLEPERTGKQELGLSLKLLNLEYDETTGSYYLPFDQLLELQMQVTGYQKNYNYTVQWGDGETTNKAEEANSTVVQKHKFTARGSMQIKITVTDINGRSKTSSLYVTVR